jgi:GGDEF domain-containing protein
MNNIGKYKNKFLIGLFSIILILTLSIVLIPNNNTDLELLIENFKEELVENIGNYDTRQIVLKDTSKSEAEEIAERLNAKLRINKDGSFAALTLPIGVTIEDIVNDKKEEKKEDNEVSKTIVSILVAVAIVTLALIFLFRKREGGVR